MVSGSSPLRSFRARRDWCGEARMLVSGLKAEKLVRIGASFAQGIIFPTPIFALRARLDIATYQVLFCWRHGSDVANDSGWVSPHWRNPSPWILSACIVVRQCALHYVRPGLKTPGASAFEKSSTRFRFVSRRLTLIIPSHFSNQDLFLSLQTQAITVSYTTIKMPEITQTLDAEQAEFDSKVKQIEEWWSSPRQSHIKRKVLSPSLVVHG